ncbi:hypothetical protein [Leisingera sp. ANG59]|uniref:hypothetical protein n=1 Tax=Leisingera sp. ANG59 TaxID=2675221 RepID=UPI001574E5E6|nr:hypothetical protein [Leisingera sp. ANG59]NSY39692.1 hypothetical protein [Leisingera sp. ANG59]
MAVEKETYIWAVKCLNGEISPEMRMVALQWKGSNVKFRYYLDREPTDFIRERAEIVAVNFDSGLSHPLDTLDIEFIFSGAPLGKLDCLDAVLFRRWENEAGTTSPD